MILVYCLAYFVIGLLTTMLVRVNFEPTDGFEHDCGPLLASLIWPVMWAGFFVHCAGKATSFLVEAVGKFADRKRDGE